MNVFPGFPALSDWRTCSLALTLTLFPTALPAEPVVEHIVRDGQTLSALALEYLDDPTLWPELGAANDLRNPHLLPIGLNIGIPLELLRKKAGGATVMHVSGTVTRSRPGQAAAPLRLDERVVDGDIIETGANGFVTLQLADGSHVRITGNSIAHMQKLKYVVRRQRSDTDIEMQRGRVESTVAPQAGGNRFRIRSPLMAAGVRGTHFGVSITDQATVTSDVLEGSVQLSSTASRTSLRLDAGHGTVAASASQLARPTRLLEAPDLSSIPELHQQPLLDLAFPAVQGASEYRLYVALDAAMHRVVANTTATTPRMRIPDLPDGNYYISLRAIDAAGIDGKPATRRIELDARPLPPLTLSPVHHAEQALGDVTLRWTELPEAIGYGVELARDEQFHAAVFEPRLVQGTETNAAELPSGSYFWRVRTIARDADGAFDYGPYSDARRFSVRRALPVRPVQAGDQLHLRWEGEPGQRFFLEVSDEPAFAAPVVQLHTDAREADLSSLPGGDYYLRVQVTDSDGYVRPFSPTQQFRAKSFLRTDHEDLVRLQDGSPLERGH